MRVCCVVVAEMEDMLRNTANEGMYACMYVRYLWDIFSCMCICRLICVLSLGRFMRVHLHVDLVVYVCTCVDMYVCIHAYKSHIYAYIHTYIHTYTITVRSSRLCASPSGDAPNSGRLFELLAGGCVPLCVCMYVCMYI